jgi:hypothetical protein
MNTEREANFGVLFDDTDKEEYYLYYKGDLNDPGNPKRYFTAGTRVNIISAPLPLTIKRYHYRNGKVNENIDAWVEIDDKPASGTGPVVNQINDIINGQINFPETKEYLREYTSNSPDNEE